MAGVSVAQEVINAHSVVTSFGPAKLRPENSVSHFMEFPLPYHNYDVTPAVLKSCHIWRLEAYAIFAVVIVNIATANLLDIMFLGVLERHRTSQTQFIALNELATMSNTHAL